MGLVVEYWARCDGCSTSEVLVEHTISSRQSARKEARSKGWVVSKAGWFCPRCTQQRQRQCEQYHVEDGAIVDRYGAIMYDSCSLNGLSPDARFRLAHLHTVDPDLDWEHAEALLIAEGLITSQPRAGQQPDATAAE